VRTLEWGMTRTLITAIASAIPAGSAPAEIVFIPEGRHTITPLTHPQGVTVNVPSAKGEAIAATLQVDLDKRLGENVKPWFDFEHTRKFPASGYPTAFRYEPGVGIMCALDWSSSGRTAVEGRDVGYFSPEFYVDADGIPNGLPDRGPVGGMVTEPAFRDSPRIAASDAASDHDPHLSSTMKLILASLGIDPAAADAESAGARAIEALKSKITAGETSLATITSERNTLMTEIAGLREKVTASETAAKDAAKKRADDLVAAAIGDGRIPALNTAKADKFRERIAAGDTFAEETLAELPKTADGLESPIIKDGEKDPKNKDKKTEGEKPPMERLAAALAENK
jgi:phage I-like protein